MISHPAPVQRRIHRFLPPLRDVRLAVEEGTHALRFPLGLPNKVVVVDPEDLNVPLLPEPRVQSLEVDRTGVFQFFARRRTRPRRVSITSCDSNISSRSRSMKMIRYLSLGGRS